MPLRSFWTVLPDPGLLPESMQGPQVWPYLKQLRDRPFQLCCKRMLDLLGSAGLLCLLWPVMLGVAAAIRLDSPGGAIFRQTRITQYGRPFTIYKFRTMRRDAGGAGVTSYGDPRVTPIGGWLRASRLDELPQLINILKGEMSFVGARPEVPEYVACYTPEMMATLLLPAGLTGMASILYRDEAELMRQGDPDRIYRETVLPGKMQYNLCYLRQFSCLLDLKLMARTIFPGRTEKDSRRIRPEG